MILNLSGMRYQSIHLIAIFYLFNNKGCFFQVGWAEGVVWGVPGNVYFPLLYFPFISGLCSLFPHTFFFVVPIVPYFLSLSPCLFFLICVISVTYSEDILPYFQWIPYSIKHMHTWNMNMNCSSKSSSSDGGCLALRM